MRLIDADTLCVHIEEEFDGVCVYDVSGNEAAREFCDMVDIAPTIDAIPVRQLEYYNDTFDGVLTIGNVLKAWKDKQFPFFSDHSKGECNEEI